MGFSNISLIIEELEKRIDYLALIVLDLNEGIKFHYTEGVDKYFFVPLLSKLKKDLLCDFEKCTSTDFFIETEPKKVETPTDLEFLTLDQVVSLIQDSYSVVIGAFRGFENSKGLLPERFFWSGNILKCTALVTNALNKLSDDYIKEIEGNPIGYEPIDDSDKLNSLVYLESSRSTESTVVSTYNQEEGYSFGYSGDLQHCLALTLFLRHKVLGEVLRPEEGILNFRIDDA